MWSMFTYPVLQLSSDSSYTVLLYTKLSHISASEKVLVQDGASDQSSERPRMSSWRRVQTPAAEQTKHTNIEDLFTFM